jgi:hypothetical protein
MYSICPNIEVFQKDIDLEKAFTTFLCKWVILLYEPQNSNMKEIKILE